MSASRLGRRGSRTRRARRPRRTRRAPALGARRFWDRRALLPLRPQFGRPRSALAGDQVRAVRFRRHAQSSLERRQLARPSRSAHSNAEGATARRSEVLHAEVRSRIARVGTRIFHGHGHRTGTHSDGQCSRRCCCRSGQPALVTPSARVPGSVGLSALPSARSCTRPSARREGGGGALSGRRRSPPRRRPRAAACWRARGGARLVGTARRPRARAKSGARCSPHDRSPWPVVERARKVVGHHQSRRVADAAEPIATRCRSATWRRRRGRPRRGATAARRCRAPAPWRERLHRRRPCSSGTPPTAAVTSSIEPSRRRWHGPGRALAHEDDARALHHQARDALGVGDRADRSDAARAQTAALHDHGVELDAARRVEDGAVSRVEGLVVLERAHRALHRSSAEPAPRSPRAAGAPIEATSPRLSDARVLPRAAVYDVVVQRLDHVPSAETACGRARRGSRALRSRKWVQHTESARPPISDDAERVRRFPCSAGGPPPRSSVRSPGPALDKSAPGVAHVGAVPRRREIRPGVRAGGTKERVGAADRVQRAEPVARGFGRLRRDHPRDGGDAAESSDTGSREHEREV